MSLPELPPPLSLRQYESLQAIVNALLPPLSSSNGTDNDEIQRYWSYDLSSDADFMNALVLAIQMKLHTSEQLAMKFLLFSLSTRLGSLMLCHMVTPFSRGTVEECTLALQTLQHSSLTLKRQAFSSLKRLVCGLAYSYINTDSNTNPFWKAMQYPGPPKSMPEATPDFDTSRAFLNISQDCALSYDIVIVGSGAGGGVAAAILAQSGYSVLILEKGSYIPASQVTNLECQALDQMYEKHSLLTTNDGNIMILAGSTLGGGTTVNWACCLPLPDMVRNEWIHQHGLTQFDSREYYDSLQAVQDRIGCHFPTTHNTMNQKFIKGCHIMGYDCQETGQNLRDTSVDSAGYTCFGDAQRNKQGGLVTYLSDAVDAGAKILPHAAVQSILVETNSGRKRATGVVAAVNDQYRVEVHANKCVVVAAGSLNSPCLLQRSKFRNPHIGRHLHLHPVTAAFGFYPHEVIHSYLGAPMTTVCSDFTNTKVECPCAHTGLLAAGLPFLSPHDFKEKMLRLYHAVPLIVLNRDVESEGRVRVGEDGFSPSIDYRLAESDERNILNALKGAIQVLIASGASEVGTGHNDDPGLYLMDEMFRTSDEIRNSSKTQCYLKLVDERGMQKHKIGIFSAHQMSTCRMSASPESGVVDENGETWECDDLMIFDASVFPTASGANPMLTALTISHMLSKRLAWRLKLEDDASAGTMGVTSETTELMYKRRKKQKCQPRYGYYSWPTLPWVATIVAGASIGIFKYWQK